MEQLTFLSESAKYISPAPEKLRGIHIKSLIREKVRFEMGLPWSLALPNGLYVYNFKERQRKTVFSRCILTSAVRYSRIAALYTAAVAPTRPWLVVLFFRCLWIRPTGNYRRHQIFKC